MWQNLLRPSAVFTKTSEVFAPYYLAGIRHDMRQTTQKKKLLKAKIAVALHDELGRVPKTEEIDQVFLMARVMYKAVLGLHFQRQQQKKNGQMAIF